MGMLNKREKEKRGREGIELSKGEKGGKYMGILNQKRVELL